MSHTRTAEPLAQHLNRRLKPFRFGVPLATAAVLSLAFGIGSLVFRVRSDAQLLAALSPHVSLLIETQDRSDLLRLIKSVAEKRGSVLIVTEAGVVQASSRDTSEIDRPYVSPKSLFSIGPLSVSTEGLLLAVPAERPNGPKNLNASLISIAGLAPFLSWSIVIAALVLAIGVAVSSAFGRRMMRTIDDAMAPVKDLDRAIRDLRDLKNPQAPPSDVLELENIRRSTIQAHRELSNARDALAVSKATEMTAEAYRLLIHDLHTPMVSLNNLVQIVDDETLDEQTHREAALLMNKTAGQIVNQIGSAKSTLDFERVALSNEDIRDCVHEAAELAHAAIADNRRVELRRVIPSEPVCFPHDATLLKRAITNLVSNAMDSCQSTVEVTVERSDGHIQIRVQDDGPGLSQEKVSIYLQGRGRSTKADRAAFGLVATNHIVRSHGGRIIYTPSRLGGACFEVRI